MFHKMNDEGNVHTIVDVYVSEEDRDPYQLIPISQIYTARKSPVEQIESQMSNDEEDEEKSYPIRPYIPPQPRTEPRTKQTARKSAWEQTKRQSECSYHDERKAQITSVRLK